MQLNRFNEIKLTWKNNFNELLDKNYLPKIMKEIMTFT